MIYTIERWSTTDETWLIGYHGEQGATAPTVFTSEAAAGRATRALNADRSVRSIVYRARAYVPQDVMEAQYNGFVEEIQKLVETRRPS